ncbi:MAG: bifunctional hydroxymethylpyrimidine kinase/phosphomethylpyrimidine kinase [Acidobacteriota bacterium]
MPIRAPGVRPPRLLTIAGSDSGGGAGIQADLKTFAAHGAYGMSAVTAVTAQNTVAVTAIHDVPPAVVAAQIDAVFDDLGVDGVKIGMLSQAPLVEAVAERLRRHLEGRAIPVVLDPVMVAKSGDVLLAESAVEALVAEMVPLATLVTPNLPEAHHLTGIIGDDEDARRRMAEALAGGGAGGPAVLVKGGHGEGDTLVDLLYDGERFHRYVGPRLATRSDHGTGCTLSSAIAARLARGEPLPGAVEGAIDYLRKAIAAAFPLGAGRGPVHHFH